MPGQILRGNGFSVQVPDGFVLVPSNPMMAFWTQMARMYGMPVPLTSYVLLPPGSQPPPFATAIISIDEMHPGSVMQLMQEFYNLENPWVAQMTAQSLGLMQIYNISPPRQVSLPSGASHVREFDCVGPPPFGFLLHFMAIIIQGQYATVKVLVGVKLEAWAQFIGPALSLVAGINLAGGSPIDAQILAIADPGHLDQVELNVIDPHTKLRTPVMSLPAGAAYNVTVNYNYTDNSTRVEGSITGVGIAVGQHSLSSVTTGRGHGGAR